MLTDRFGSVWSSLWKNNLKSANCREISADYDFVKGFARLTPLIATPNFATLITPAGGLTKKRSNTSHLCY